MRRFLRILCVVAFTVFFGTMPISAATEIYGVTFIWQSPGCTSQDYLANLASNTPGAGVFPTVPSTIIGYSITTVFAAGSDYAMLGHTQPNGDTMTGYVYGTGRETMLYPAGSGFAFNPGESIAATAGAAQGTTALSFSSPSFVTPEMYAVDETNPSAIASGSRVQSVSGSTVTLDTALASAVVAGDQIEFFDQIHLHYRCQANNSAENSDTIVVTLFYTTP